MDERPEVRTLLEAVRDRLPELEQLLTSCSDHWGYEDPIYRFYHQSLKVYNLQSTTLRIVSVLRELSSDHPLDAWFEDIVSRETGQRFDVQHNLDWPGHTRPIVEAFFHAKYFLEMVVRYGRELKEPPTLLPSGWAAVLCLHGLR